MRRLIPILAVLALVAALPAAASATAPGADGRIAFVRAGDIWTINPDGTGKQQITTNPAADREPAWSPNGKLIAFTRADATGESVYTIDPAGGPARLVVANAEHPSWSPDGTAIAYSRPRPLYPSDLRIIRITDGRDRLVRSGDQFAALIQPEWSPNGRELVYDDAFEDSTQLRRIAIDGTSDRPVTGLPAYEDIEDAFFTPSWSPDSRTIAYARSIRRENDCRLDEQCFELDIATVRADGTADRRVLNWQRTTERNPVFAPSGARIAFDSDIGGVRQIWTMRPDGTGLVRVTTHPDGGSDPSWQTRPR